MFDLFSDPSVPNFGKLVGQLASTLDEGSIVERADFERILQTAWASARETAKRPLHMARSAPWDYLRPEVPADHKDFLKNLLGAKVCEDSALESSFLAGAPERMDFIQRHLPGVVEGHPWDGHPTNAISWEFDWPDFVDEPVPFVELARAQMGDDPKQNAPVKKVDGFDVSDFSPKYFQPVTTKAGGRLWSISFALPGGEVKGLRAAYPYQLLVRLDLGRQCLIYEALDYVPRTQSCFARDAQETDPVSPAELKTIEGNRVRKCGSRVGCLSVWLFWCMLRSTELIFKFCSLKVIGDLWPCLRHPETASEDAVKPRHFARSKR